MHLISFGRYVALLRKEMNLSQQELAEMVDCALSTISRIENGHQMPERKMFDALEKVFGKMGLIYDELVLDNLVALKGAGAELLESLRYGRAEEIERKLNVFHKYMNKEDSEHRQYCIFAHLECIKKKGMALEQYLLEVINIFEIGRKLPDYADIAVMYLSKIEYELLRFIGMTHMNLGEYDKAETIFRGLLANKIDPRSPFIRERYVSISASLAKLLLRKQDYCGANECLAYLFNVFIESSDSRLFFNSLSIQEEMCEAHNDVEGGEAIHEFIEATQKLMGFIHKKYQCYGVVQ